MELRDHYILNAPKEIPNWFKPVIRKRPEDYPRPGLTLDAVQEQQWQGLGDWLDEKDVQPEVVAYEEARCKRLDEIEAWEEDYLRERLLQWPIWWADNMMSRSYGIDPIGTMILNAQIGENPYMKGTDAYIVPIDDMEAVMKMRNRRP